MEEQIVLRAPPAAAAVIRRVVRGECVGVPLHLEPMLDASKTRFRLVVGDTSYPAMVVNLPTVVETHKVGERGAVFKSGEVARMIYAWEEPASRGGGGGGGASATSAVGGGRAMFSSMLSTVMGGGEPPPPPPELTLVPNPTPGSTDTVLDSGLTPPMAHAVQRRFRRATRFISRYTPEEVALVERQLLDLMANTEAGAALVEHVVMEMVDAEAWMAPWFTSGGDNVTLVYEDGVCVDMYQLQHADGASTRWLKSGDGAVKGAPPAPRIVRPNEDGTFGIGASAKPYNDARGREASAAGSSGDAGRGGRGGRGPFGRGGLGRGSGGPGESGAHSHATPGALGPLPGLDDGAHVIPGLQAYEDDDMDGGDGMMGGGLPGIGEVDMAALFGLGDWGLGEEAHASDAPAGGVTEAAAGNGGVGGDGAPDGSGGSGMGGGGGGGLDFGAGLDGVAWKPNADTDVQLTMQDLAAMFGGGPPPAADSVDGAGGDVSLDSMWLMGEDPLKPWATASPGPSTAAAATATTTGEASRWGDLSLTSTGEAGAMDDEVPAASKPSMSAGDGGDSGGTAVLGAHLDDATRAALLAQLATAQSKLDELTAAAASLEAKFRSATIAKLRERWERDWQGKAAEVAAQQAIVASIADQLGAGGRAGS